MTIDASQDIRTLNEMRTAIQDAENGGDAEFIAALFSDDAVLMVPDFPVQEGKAACAGFIRALLPDLLVAFDRRIIYTSAEVRVIGDLALDRGEFACTTRPRDGGTADCMTGKYLWLYERTTSGLWRSARMIASRDEDRSDRSTSRPRRTYPRAAPVLGLLFGASALLLVGPLLWPRTPRDGDVTASSAARRRTVTLR